MVKLPSENDGTKQVGCQHCGVQEPACASACATFLLRNLMQVAQTGYIDRNTFPTKPSSFQYLYRDYFKAEVYTIWAHGPLGRETLRQREAERHCPYARTTTTSTTTRAPLQVRGPWTRCLRKRIAKIAKLTKLVTPLAMIARTLLFLASLNKDTKK